MDKFAQCNPKATVKSSMFYPLVQAQKDSRSYSGCPINMLGWQHSNEVRIKFALLLTEEGEVMSHKIKTNFFKLQF